ncbi:glycine cleavage system protein H [candidate division GN15 bacterium]|uniref:Glycine cleavage system H protein n=1 Tax=candidate division GN15 bacterium TaxID=2072418 RepID=A0A855WWX2_9BACT|nr:MAG: glycine cleavage system protein H [candidate division GN15 bacterium]
MKVLANLKYTKEHEWVKVDGSTATVGITDFAQGELGDIVFIELPEIGLEVKQMGKFGTIEAVKAVSDMYSPLSGKIVAINSALDSDPMIVNKDPYGEGWMVKLQITDPSELNKLLDAKAYEGLLKEH